MTQKPLLFSLKKGAHSQKRLLSSDPLLCSAEKMWERREGWEGPIANITRSDWQLCVPQPASAEGPPVHTRNWYPRLQKPFISSSFFLRNKAPFLVLIVCCSGLCNWYSRGQSCVCVCVCVCYVWILRKAAWYFIFKLWLLLHSPTYNGTTPEGWIVFCYQFSKKNKATQANATKRTGVKFSPWRFSFSKKYLKRSQKLLSHQCSSQLHAAVLLQAVEYCASPSNCCGFRDFSRFLFLEICWSSASFPQLSTRPLYGSVLTTAFYYEVSPHLKESAIDLPGLRSWRRQNPDMLITDWCYGSPFLQSLPFRWVAQLTK